MTSYEEQALTELRQWQLKMQRKPSFTGRLSKRIQDKINGFIPEKVHSAITVTIQKMVQLVLFGSKYTASNPIPDASLLYREAWVKKKIETYRTTAATEGALTGAGGILWGFADFPLLIELN